MAHSRSPSSVKVVPSQSDSIPVRTRVVLPVGKQVMPLKPGQLSSQLPAQVTATRVWLESRRGQLLLHIGDISAD